MKRLHIVGILFILFSALLVFSACHAEKKEDIATEEQIEQTEEKSYPWQDGGKLPSEYTWDEFIALDEYAQEAFFNWFGTPEEFEAWMNGAQKQTEAPPEAAFSDVDKKPEEYTWEEFQAMSEEEQESFFNAFETPEAFEAWMHAAQEENQEAEYPWENGGKLPTEYTWEEFSSLDEFAQEAFFNWFNTPEDFEAWMNRVNP